MSTTNPKKTVEKLKVHVPESAQPDPEAEVVERRKAEDVFSDTEPDSSNPFFREVPEHDFAFYLAGVIRLIVGFPISIIRFVIGVAWLILVCSLATILTPKKANFNNVISIARLRIGQFIIRWGAVILAVWIGMNIKQTDTMNRDKNARILISNHCSFLDFFVVCRLGQFSFVAKEEINRVPFIGHAARVMQSLFVDREKGPSGTSDRIIAHVKNHQLPPLVIFPQGTTSTCRLITPFRSGAFVAGEPVQPIIIKYKRSRWEMDQSDSTFSTLPYLFRMLMQPLTRVEVRWLPLLEDVQSDPRSPSAFAEAARGLYVRALHTEPCDYTYKDKLVYQGGVPYEAASPAWKSRFAKGYRARERGHGFLYALFVDWFVGPRRSPSPIPQPKKD